MTKLLKEPLKVRNLLVRARVFRSQMVINQKNITFGRMVVGEHATKCLTLKNRSSVPLLYAVSKHASINSGYLKVPHLRRGIVRPHGSRELELGLTPGLSGKFEETLELRNVQDPTNTQVGQGAGFGPFYCG